MPISKRRAGWQVDVRVSGQRVRRTVATKALAAELETKLRDDAGRIKAGLQPNRTLADALVQHLTAGAKALRSYDSLLYVARVIRPHLSRPIDQIADAAAAIIREGQKKGRQPATINRHLALLRKIGNQAYVWRWVDSPVGKRVQLLPERNERHVYLTREQVAQVAAKCKSEGARDAVLLAAYTGLRRGELLALRPENWRDGALWLSTSKSGRPRRVPVPPDAQEICARLPLTITANALRRDFAQARTALALSHVHFHDLRHTYASWLIQAGVDLISLKSLMGHSTLQMTSRYAHLEDANLDAAVARLGGQTVTKPSPKRPPRARKVAKIG